MNTLLERNAEAEVQKLIGQLPGTCDDDISLAILSRADGKISLPADPSWLCRCGSRNSLDVLNCQNCGGDFVKIYQNVKIGRDKPKTFLELNRSPEKERRILGLPVQSAGTVEMEKNAGTPDHQSQQGKEQRPIRQNTGLPASAMSGYAFGGEEYRNTQDDKKGGADMALKSGRKGKKPSENQESESSGKQRDLLQGGLKGLGESDAVPKLVLLLAGVILVQTILIAFLFVKDSQQNHRIDQLIAAVEGYHEAAQDIGVGCYEVKDRVVHIMDNPGGEEKVDSLSRGDIVYQIDEETKVVRSVTWIKVQTQNETTGWCRLDALLPLEK